MNGLGPKTGERERGQKSIKKKNYFPTHCMHFINMLIYYFPPTKKSVIFSEALFRQENFYLMKLSEK